MHRFVALVSDAASEHQESLIRDWTARLLGKPGWRLVLDNPGLMLACHSRCERAPVAACMHRDIGAVVGQLFRNGEEQRGPIPALCEIATRRICAGNADHLVRDHWGAYVAIWRDPTTRAIRLLRDPCGAPPCFITHANGATIVFSEICDIAGFEGVAWSIDWEYVKAFLLYSYFTTPHTGLREVKELLAGDCVTLEPGRAPAHAWTWNAARIAATPVRQGAGEARTALRSTAERVFCAWGGAHANILVQLSGGLDSSILLNLLRRHSRAEIHALHFIGADYEAYEHRLARQAARRAGVALIEAQIEASTADLSPILCEPCRPRPTRQIFGLPADGPLAEACRTSGASVLMAGHGGDALFLQRVLTGQALEDYLRLNGFGPDFWRVAYDTACVQERSLWSPVGEALASRMKKRPWRPFAFLDARIASGHGLLTPDAIAGVDSRYKLHPWLGDAGRLPPCKAGQVQAIVSLQGYHALRNRTVVGAMSPWYSQPLVEFALQTPTYMFSGGGIDRALERDAFADIIPEAIVRRTGKGLIDHQLLVTTRHNIGFLRELVLDGEIIRRDWFDRQEVERMLSPEHLVDGARMSALFGLVAAEAWVATCRAAQP